MNFQAIMEKRGISSDCTLLQALESMDKRRVKMLLLFRGEKFLGIVTVGDIQRAIIRNPDLSMSLSAILEGNKDYARPEDSLARIKERMLAMRAECMPVVDADGNLAGLYEWGDLFGAPTAALRAKIDLPIVIMAGGMGTRLKPLTNVIPKPMIPVGDRTILEIILDQFEAIGCGKFFMSVNYKAEMLQYFLSTLARRYDIEYFREEKPMGTIGSVSLLKGRIDRPFFVSNCDIIIDQDYRDVYEYHKQAGNEITIVGAIKNYSIPYGVVETGADGIVTALREKPQTTYTVNTGVYLLNPGMIGEIPQGRFFHVTDLIDKVRARGGRVGCFPVSENAWTDIGDWAEYSKIVMKNQ